MAYLVTAPFGFCFICSTSKTNKWSVYFNSQNEQIQVSVSRRVITLTLNTNTPFIKCLLSWNFELCWFGNLDFQERTANTRHNSTFIELYYEAATWSFRVPHATEPKGKGAVALLTGVIDRKDHRKFLGAVWWQQVMSEIWGFSLGFLITLPSPISKINIKVQQPKRQVHLKTKALQEWNFCLSHQRVNSDQLKAKKTWNG